jgi:hypothetical protein
MLVATTPGDWGGARVSHFATPTPATPLVVVLEGSAPRTRTSACTTGPIPRRLLQPFLRPPQRLRGDAQTTRPLEHVLPS